MLGDCCFNHWNVVYEVLQGSVLSLNHFNHWERSSRDLGWVVTKMWMTLRPQHRGCGNCEQLLNGVQRWIRPNKLKLNLGKMVGGTFDPGTGIFPVQMGLPLDSDLFLDKQVAAGSRVPFTSFSWWPSCASSCPGKILPLQCMPWYYLVSDPGSPGAWLQGSSFSRVQF